MELNTEHITGGRISKYAKVSDEDFTIIVANSTSWKQVLIKCGFDPGIGSRHGVKRRALSMNLNTKHLRCIPFDYLQNKRRSPMVLKRRLIKSGVLEICQWCRCEHMDLNNGKWMWNKNELTLQVDHIHGRSNPPCECDDRLTNLRFLCCNCHTQTPTSKMGYKVNPPKKRPKHIRILIKSGREYVCEMCKCEHMEKGFNGAWEWRGWMLNLQCDHIDGDSSNNDISNLRWLCPNCHATTDTYCGHNKKRKRSQKSTSNAKSRLS